MTSGYRSFKVALSLLSIALTVFAFSGRASAQTCSELFRAGWEKQADFTHRLPEPGTPRFQQIVSKMRENLRRTGSFAVVDLRDIFTSEIGEAWEPLARASRGKILTKDDVESVTNKGGYRAFSALDSWLTLLVSEVISANIPKAHDLYQLRSIRGSEGSRITDWHTDGGTIAVTLSLKGPGTLVLGGINRGVEEKMLRHADDAELRRICEGCEAILVPQGHALLMFTREGSERFLPTVHSSPDTQETRALFVWRRYGTPEFHPEN